MIQSHNRQDQIEIVFNIELCMFLMSYSLINAHAHLSKRDSFRWWNDKHDNSSDCNIQQLGTIFGLNFNWKYEYRIAIHFIDLYHSPKLDILYKYYVDCETKLNLALALIDYFHVNCNGFVSFANIYSLKYFSNNITRMKNTQQKEATKKICK